MNDIQFDEDASYAIRPRGRQELSSITGLILKFGLAKDERGANFLLSCLAFSLIILAALIWFATSPSKQTTTPAQLLKDAQKPQYLP